MTPSTSLNKKTAATGRATKSGGKAHVRAHGNYERTENAEIDVFADRLACQSDGDGKDAQNQHRPDADGEPARKEHRARPRVIYNSINPTGNLAHT
jgi:hypothetical protein